MSDTMVRSPDTLVKSSSAQPDPRVQLWRYMDFTKFLSIIRDSRLFFCRLCQFGDPFEGHHPPISYDQWREGIEASKAWPSDSGRAERVISANKSMVQRHRQEICVNSWHAQESESAAMWEIYVRSGQGMAIQTTVGDLKESLRAYESRLFYGWVQYLDFSKQTLADANWERRPFMFKRISFAHEKEVRVCYEDRPNPILEPKGPLEPDRANLIIRTDRGCTFPIDRDKLIGKVILAPSTPRWLADLVKGVLADYALGHKEVQQSSLDDIP